MPKCGQRGSWIARGESGDGLLHTWAETGIVKAWSPLVLRGIFGLAAFSVFWFGLAGTLAWWQGWLCLGAFTLFVGAFAWRLATANPDLFKERNRPGGEVPSWDRWIMAIYTLVLVAQLTITALDSGRFQWSSVPVLVQVLGWIMLTAAGTVVWQVAMSNPFLSGSARVQTDRGQVVISDGWYAIIRHPMYLAITGAFIGMALALASWWALIPAMVNIGLFVYRTHREDEMLMHELPGYQEYARSVRYRLLPRVW